MGRSLVRVALTAVCAMAVVCSVVQPAVAAPGDLDPDFGGGDGQVATKFDSGDAEVLALAPQEDGKILAGGWVQLTDTNQAWALIRYKPGGQLDPTFGDGGRKVVDFTAGNDQLGGLVILRSGKIVAGGWAGSLFAAVRYLPDGHLDHSFNGDGKALVNFGSGFDNAYDVARSPGGKIVLAGYSEGPSNDRFALARLTSSGTLDKTFGGDGKVTTNMGANAYILDVLVHGDGSVVATGDVDTTPVAPAIAMYQPNGELDPAFGDGGKKIPDVGQDVYPTALVELGSHKFVVAGAARTGPTDFDVGLVRFKATGQLDETFGPNGLVTQDFESAEYTRDIRRVGTKFVLAVTRQTGQESHLCVIRLHANGSADTTFGDLGVAAATFTHAGAEALVVQGNGRIVAGGEAGPGLDSKFAVARFLPS
jgi:uncharacterized delta-60 repeat protein